MLNHPNIAVIGPGYVGMPLAVEFGKKIVTTGYDPSTNKIASYLAGRDTSGDISGDELRSVKSLIVSVHNPVAIPRDALHEYGIALSEWDALPQADAIAAAVAHNHYLDIPQCELPAKLKPGGVFVDVKSAHVAGAITAAGYQLWRL